MAIVNYITPGNCLRDKCVEISISSMDDATSYQLNELAKKMIKKMDDANGIGIAAPQVGINIRMCIVCWKFCIKGSGENRVTLMKLDGSTPPLKFGLDGCIVFINPKIVRQSEECYGAIEGCLSIPNPPPPYAQLAVIRPKEVSVEFYDLYGVRHTLMANGLLSRCCQHEIDHLNGTLYVDRLDAQIRDQAALGKDGYGPAQGGDESHCLLQ